MTKIPPLVVLACVLVACGEDTQIIRDNVPDADGVIRETLAIVIAGEGSVSASDGTTTYGTCEAPSCTYAIPRGVSGTLTATAAAGWLFHAWTGDCASDSNAAALTLDTSKGCGVTFVRDEVRVSAMASDGGSVVVDACGSQTSCTLDRGTSVTMTATADSGMRFGGWTGDAACVPSNETPTVVSFDAVESATCQANFIQQKTLSVTGSSNCSQTRVEVATCPEGSQCSCNEAHTSCTGDAGATFTLQASAIAGRVFTGWSGEGCPEGRNATLTSDTPATCAAQCVQTYTVTASANPYFREMEGTVMCFWPGTQEPVDCANAPAGSTAWFNAKEGNTGWTFFWGCNVAPAIRYETTWSTIVERSMNCIADATETP